MLNCLFYYHRKLTVEALVILTSVFLTIVQMYYHLSFNSPDHLWHRVEGLLHLRSVTSLPTSSSTLSLPFRGLLCSPGSRGAEQPLVRDPHSLAEVHHPCGGEGQHNLCAPRSKRQRQLSLLFHGFNFMAGLSQSILGGWPGGPCWTNSGKTYTHIQLRCGIGPMVEWVLCTVDILDKT